MIVHQRGPDICAQTFSFSWFYFLTSASSEAQCQMSTSSWPSSRHPHPLLLSQPTTYVCISCETSECISPHHSQQKYCRRVLLSRTFLFGLQSPEKSGEDSGRKHWDHTPALLTTLPKMLPKKSLQYHEIVMPWL